MERADRPGFWQSVTGSLEPGETHREAAVREVYEETGLDAGLYKLEDWGLRNTYAIYSHWLYRYAPGITHNVEYVFGMELPEPLPVILEPKEHINYEWVEWRSAIPRVFSWTNSLSIYALGLRRGQHV